ncbi:hypothetical protein N7474_008574 [Penicillium riverlandense]|uniref:uncharacterized protein n=1 Tax=Penicillium riverlandense TaxID=1903569 RepID=UPI002547FC71|nr:uncharacterized protein N7474_008574 [Penicillium riverlandense]KAJ5812273.1 hypothetical protein N7474_008574 [Penicillium riverlandense]
MPFSTDRNKTELKLVVAAPPGWKYAPGDTIIGDLVRPEPIITPEATVSLALMSSIRTNLEESASRKASSNSNGNRNDHKLNGNYPAEWHLLNPKPITLFSGPLHVPKNSDEAATWPFSIQIPTKPQDSVRLGHRQESSFIPLDRNHPAHNILPGSFSTGGESKDGFSECCIEYYLEAKLRYTRGNAWQSFTTTHPITIRHHVQETSLLYSLQQQMMKSKIRTPRLIPGMENVDLSMKQKMFRFFGSSKIPEFCCKLELSFPRAIQLGGPLPIPLILNITPEDEKTSESIRGVSRQVRINWIKMMICNKSAVLVPSRLTSAHYSSTHCRQEHSSTTSLRLESIFEKLESPCVISTGKDSQPINFGHMFQLVLHPHGLTYGKELIQRVPTIYPDFTTYAVKHSHMVTWAVCLSVAGEMQTVETIAEIKLVADS